MTPRRTSRRWGVREKIVRLEKGLIAGIENKANAVERALPTEHERQALTYSILALEGETRRSGDPYIVHPFRTAANLNATLPYLPERQAGAVTAITHDSVDQAAKYDPSRFHELRKMYGREFVYALDAAVLLAAPPHLDDMQRDVATAAQVSTHGTLASRVAHVFERLDNAGDLRFIKGMRKEEQHDIALHHYAKAVFSNRHVQTIPEVHQAVQTQLDKLGKRYSRSFGVTIRQTEERVDGLLETFERERRAISRAFPAYAREFGVVLPVRELQLFDGGNEYGAAAS